MRTLRKVAVATLVTLAGAAGLLVAGMSTGALGQGGPGHGDVSVVADSPWSYPQP